MEGFKGKYPAYADIPDEELTARGGDFQRYQESFIHPDLPYHKKHIEEVFKGGMNQMENPWKKYPEEGHARAAAVRAWNKKNLLKSEYWDSLRDELDELRKWQRDLKQNKDATMPYIYRGEVGDEELSPLQVTEIRSGGQDGVDWFALELAELLGIRTGGFYPRYYKPESFKKIDKSGRITKAMLEQKGLRPARKLNYQMDDEGRQIYNLEHSDPKKRGNRVDYGTRTEQNVVSTDGTLIIDYYSAPMGGGTDMYVPWFPNRRKEFKGGRKSPRGPAAGSALTARLA